MTYEDYQELSAQEEEEFWQWAEQVLTERACHNCIYWQPAQIVRGQHRPAHCRIMAELNRECYRTEATNCRTFTHISRVQ